MRFYVKYKAKSRITRLAINLHIGFCRLCRPCHVTIDWKIRFFLGSLHKQNIYADRISKPIAQEIFSQNYFPDLWNSKSEQVFGGFSLLLNKYLLQSLRNWRAPLTSANALKGLWRLFYKYPEEQTYQNPLSGNCLGSACRRLVFPFFTKGNRKRLHTGQHDFCTALLWSFYVNSR